jgi:serine/threonine protein kinase
MPTHTGRQGKVYNLAPRPFAGGGEGDIYEIANAMHLVAKKYKPKRVTTEREQKIIAMLGNPPSAQVIGQFAWPVDMLYENRQFAGYVMPRLQTPRALNDVYVYDDRKGIPWYFYISVAKNLAAVINAAHKIGHVCGDLNPDNISVDQQGVITLLDTDSYHIYDKVNSRTFRCEVGRPEYVPRELQGLHLGSAPLPTYTEETDNFTLAVLIFCLLMNGSHPFACAVTRQSVSASKFQPVGNITKGLFPFMQTQTSLSIPKYAPPITILTDELQELFKRAFVDGHRNPKARPKPDEWYYALDHLNRSLKKCANDNTHLYYAGLNDCPWCEVENKMNKAKVQGPARKPNIQQQPIKKPWPPVQTTKATPNSKMPLVVGVGIGLFLLTRMIYPGILDMISAVVPGNYSTNSNVTGIEALSNSRQNSNEAETNTDRVVIFHNVDITEITSTTAWAEVHLTAKKGGFLHWEITGDSALSDLLGFEQAIIFEHIGLLIDGLQPGTNYQIRPVFETDAEIYYGDWVTFTTK